jgi:hypothetical protein
MLIYAPAPTDPASYRWFSPNECVWDGPDCLQKFVRIKETYPDLSRFFQINLDLKNAGWEHLMHEAQTVSASDSTEYISNVLVAINDYMVNARNLVVPAMRKLVLSRLAKSTIFPIHAGKSEGIFDYLSSANPDEMWFIADRWHLKHSFDKIVPLLALELHFVDKIGYLINHLGLEERRLSRLASGTPKMSGSVYVLPEYTRSLRTKARYITRWVAQ